MFIRKLQLTNYKNHEKKVLFFDKNLVAFVGLNGIGKTNILDSIYHLCIGKSYFTNYDKNCIQTEKDFFRISCTFDNQDEILVINEFGKKKKIFLNDVEYEKNRYHVGKYPIVLLAPDDNILIIGGSEERRKLIDQTLSQIDAQYLEHLINYNHILKQRNALLKAAEGQINRIDKHLLGIYDKQLVNHAQYIFDKRANFFEKGAKVLAEMGNYFSEKQEQHQWEYKSQLKNESYEKLLQQNLTKDCILQRTSVGIHRDDAIFLIDNEKLKYFGSQGQQKTFLLALKLTQYNFLKVHLNKLPLFVIDDIFDKLDDHRSQKLVQFLIASESQIFVSHTSPLKFDSNKSDIQIVELKHE